MGVTNNILFFTHKIWLCFNAVRHYSEYNKVRGVECVESIWLLEKLPDTCRLQGVSSPMR